MSGTHFNLLIRRESWGFGVLGFWGFGAFNADAVKDIQLYTGGSPRRWGEACSSVTEITGKDGNQNNFNIGGSVSLLSVNAFAEIPIGDNFTSLFAFRRSFEGGVTAAATAAAPIRRPKHGECRKCPCNHGAPVRAQPDWQYQEAGGQGKQPATSRFLMLAQLQSEPRRLLPSCRMRE